MAGCILVRDLVVGPNFLLRSQCTRQFPRPVANHWSVTSAMESLDAGQITILETRQVKVYTELSQTKQNPRRSMVIFNHQFAIWSNGSPLFTPG